MEVAGPAFPGLKDLLILSAIDIYGEPSERLLEQMRRKARLRGNARFAVQRLHAGFARLV